MKYTRKRRTKYLTKRALTQRIGLTKGSVDDLDEIRLILTDVTDMKYTRALLIRRAIEVYRYYLVDKFYNEQLLSELAQIADIEGKKGRPPERAALLEPLEGGI